MTWQRLLLHHDGAICQLGVRQLGVCDVVRRFGFLALPEITSIILELISQLISL